MVKFIIQEGDEKSDDIDLKAEEEFHMMKGDLIQRGRIKINQEYDLKERRLHVTLLTKNSVFVNENRMREIIAKQKIIDGIRKQARENIISDLQCKAKYSNILSLLIIEGLYKVMESPVFICCKEKDIPLIKKIIPICEEIYSEGTNVKVELKINNEKFLPEDSIGGVELYIKNHKVMISNTLDARTDHTIKNCTPPISRCLFGTISRQDKF